MLGIPEIAFDNKDRARHWIAHAKNEGEKVYKEIISIINQYEGTDKCFLKYIDYEFTKELNDIEKENCIYIDNFINILKMMIISHSSEEETDIEELCNKCCRIYNSINDAVEAISIMDACEKARKEHSKEPK